MRIDANVILAQGRNRALQRPIRRAPHWLMTGLLLLLFIGVCAQAQTFEPVPMPHSPVHFLISAHLPSQEQAKQACYRTAREFGYLAEQYCYRPTGKTSPPEWVAGWLRNPPWSVQPETFFYLRFSFPDDRPGITATRALRSTISTGN